MRRYLPLFALCLVFVSFVRAEPAVVLAKSVVPNLVEDMRYATPNNFLHAAVYDDDRCWLKPTVAQKLAKAAKLLAEQHPGWRLKVWDCNRPRSVQFKMWAIVPDTRYVADPNKGSRHNTGTAVDLTIVDENSREVEMPTEFDNFTRKARADAPTTPTAAANRALLREVMTKAGFQGIATEWWHFQG